MLGDLLKHLFQLDELEHTYKKAVAERGERDLFATLADMLQIRSEISPGDRERIPRSGPLVVISNHPTGGMDGILLNAFLLSVRRDCRILAHVWFRRFEDLARYMVFVDPAGSSSQRDIVLAMRAATEWLGQGGLLVVNPAGAVSCFQPRRMRVTDLPWQNGIAKIVTCTRADVLPVHIDGRNSNLFQALCCVHPRAGALLLARELFNKRGQTLTMRVGKPIPFTEIPERGSMVAITEYLRSRTCQLEGAQ
jgi:putative hemolysin